MNFDEAAMKVRRGKKKALLKSSHISVLKPAMT